MSHMNLSEPLIEFRNVVKSYKNVLALNNVSFSLNQGDIFGYIGPNGAGKSTTIKIMVGLIRDFSGTLLINGKDIKTSYLELFKNLGYHPQEAGFQRWKTVYQALRTFGKLSKIENRFLDSRIVEVLEFVNLKEVMNRKIIHLSGGMLQKLRLAQALLGEPEILVLDEPLTGLDPASRYQIKNLIKKLANSGKTILFSSHILSDVQDIATKIGILNLGKLVKIGRPSELQSEYHIGNRIQIEFDNDIDILDQLQNLNYIEQSENKSANVIVVNLKVEADLDDSIHDLLRYLIENKYKLRRFNLLTPSLEDVYLKLVQGENNEL